MTQEAYDVVTRDQAIRDLVTPAGKKLGIYPVRNSALYTVAFTSGGELPKELKNQKFTDTTLAAREARKYLERAWEEAQNKSAKKTAVAE